MSLFAFLSCFILRNGIASLLHNLYNFTHASDLTKVAEVF
jgi:hypothetical protein